MKPANQEAHIHRVFELFKVWDRGDEATRKKILGCFIKQNQNKTGPELEFEFAEGASLMLARISAWLRISFMFCSALPEQLDSINIFLSASCGHQFMTEFIEIGGIFTLVSILRVAQLPSNSKLKAIICLQSISNAGRKYKELICESHGLTAIAEFLAKSTCGEAHENCQQLLLSLFNANPKYQLQLYKTFIALLPCSSPKPQQIAVNSLRLIQPMMDTALPSLVRPLLILLRTLHLEVQYEVINYIKELMAYDVRDAILNGLVGMLDSSRADIALPDVDSMNKNMSTTTPTLTQKSAAAKTIGIIVQVYGEEITEALIPLQVIPKLIEGVCNPSSSECQIHCSLALRYFANVYPELSPLIEDSVGPEVFQILMSTPRTKNLALSANEEYTMDKFNDSILQWNYIARDLSERMENRKIESKESLTENNSQYN
ncbi:armadillo-like helical domain containing protein 1 [Argonauta hians]